MKIKNLHLILLSLAVVLFSSYSILSGNGAPSGRTGSPGDGSNCSSCHSQAAGTTPGLITSNIPASGYVPGQTYQITATNTLTGSGKYGFEVSPQNASGTQLGTLAAGTGSKLVGGTKYVTHSSSNTSTNTWTFGWTAPAAGTGTVTFYGAFAKSHPGPTTLSTLIVQEAASTPAAAGAISGQTSVCANSTETYSVGTITGATSYVWTAPSGASITGGQGTTSITVTIGSSTGTGNLSVYGSNTNGNGAPSNLTVTINSAPAATTAITGGSNPCQNSIEVYSVTDVPGTTYPWSVPSGSTIVSGQGSHLVNVTFSATSGDISVVPSNSCGSAVSTNKAITVSPVAAQASNVAGSTSPCQASVQTYSVTNVAGINYAWSVPAGSSITSGQGTNSITMTTGTGNGVVSVIPSNSCGAGESTNLAITVNLLPAIPSTPDGPAVVNLAFNTTSNYTTATGATSYVWQLTPANAGVISGTTATALVTWNASFTGNAGISVKGLNTCGESTWSPVKTTQITNTTGLDESNSGISVSTNKSGYISVSMNTDAYQANVMVLDLTGRLIEKSTIPGKGTSELNQNLKTGIYLVVVDAGKSELKKKIFVN